MERTRPSWERWLAVAGFAYVVVHFLFLTRGVGPDSNVAAVQRAFTQSPAQEMQQAVLYEVSVLLLLLFALSVRAHLRPAEDEPKTLSTAVLAAAVAAAVLALVGSSMLFVLEASVARLGDANLTYALLLIWWATFFAYSLMLSILAIAASASALLSRAFPRWIGWLGVVCGLALAGGCLAFYPSGAVVQGPADGIAYIGEILFAVWTIASSVIVLRGPRTVPAADAAGVRTETALA